MEEAHGRGLSMVKGFRYLVLLSLFFLIIRPAYSNEDVSSQVYDSLTWLNQTDVNKLPPHDMYMPVFVHCSKFPETPGCFQILHGTPLTYLRDGEAELVEIYCQIVTDGLIKLYVHLEKESIELALLKSFMNTYQSNRMISGTLIREVAASGADSALETLLGWVESVELSLDNLTTLFALIARHWDKAFEIISPYIDNRSQAPRTAYAAGYGLSYVVHPDVVSKLVLLLDEMGLSTLVFLVHARHQHRIHLTPDEAQKINQAIINYSQFLDMRATLRLKYLVRQGLGIRRFVQMGHLSLQAYLDANAHEQADREAIALASWAYDEALSFSEATQEANDKIQQACAKTPLGFLMDSWYDDTLFWTPHEFDDFFSFGQMYATALFKWLNMQNFIRHAPLLPRDQFASLQDITPLFEDFSNDLIEIFSDERSLLHQTLLQKYSNMHPRTLRVLETLGRGIRKSPEDRITLSRYYTGDNPVLKYAAKFVLQYSGILRDTYVSIPTQHYVISPVE